MAASWKASIEDSPVALDSQGGVAVVAGSDGRAVALDVTSGRPVASTHVEGGLVSCSLSPSGDRAVLGGMFGASMWSIGDRTASVLAEGGWSAASAWASPRRVAVAWGRRVLVADEGERSWVSGEFPSTVADVCWVGGRRRIAVAAYGGVHLTEPRPKAPEKVLPFKGSLLGLTVTPNGRWLVSGNQDATVQVFRTDGQDRLEMTGYPSKIERLAFDSSGRFLANDGARDVTVWDFAGPGPRGRSPVLVSSPEESVRDEVGAFAWHPSSPRLAVGWHSGLLAEYEVVRGVRGHRLLPSRVIARELSSVQHVAWTADGRGVLSATARGEIARHPGGDDR